MKNKLNGKIALITGATGGIGEAIVERFVESGIKVIASAPDPNKLNKLKKKYSQITIIAADLSSNEQTEALAVDSLKKSGGLDILVNNAGFGIAAEVSDMNPADFMKMFAVNVTAVFLLSKIIGTAMTENKSGYIINIGSGASTTPIATYSGYCATKHALLGFSESHGLELRKHGVKVSIVMPGSTATRFGGLDPAEKLKNKPGILLPEDVAESVMYLLKQPQRAWTSQVNLRPLDLTQKFE